MDEEVIHMQRMIQESRNRIAKIALELHKEQERLDDIYQNMNVLIVKGE